MQVSVAGVLQDAGCWVDGRWGQYGASRLLGIADGLLGSSFYEDAAAEMLADPDDGCMTDELPGCETVSWAADAALDALNDATVSGYWEWHDGELFLSPVDECSACGAWVSWDGSGWADEDEATDCPAGGEAPHYVAGRG